MAISREIQYASLEQFRVDPENPRLRHLFEGIQPTQNQILEELENFKLDELAVSFISSGGFWVQEAVLVLPEKIDGTNFLTVVEGNRRIAALMKLQSMLGSTSARSSKWRGIAALAVSHPPSPELFAKIPYLTIDERSDVDEYLGFRHVTGIEQWNPPEKAAYIAKLIDERGMSYEDVRRKIGSKAPVVRQLYIAYRIYCQLQEADALPEKEVGRFSVLYLSLRTPGVQKRLGLDMNASPDEAKVPVRQEYESVLPHFGRWMYGDDASPPIFTDSRQVDLFGRILESDEAFNYLCENKDARFEHARILMDGDHPEAVHNVKKASEYIRLALAQAHRYTDMPDLQKAMKDFSTDAFQLMSVFSEMHPDFRNQFQRKIGE